MTDKNKKSVKGKKIPIPYRDVSADPHFNTDTIPEPERSLDEVLDMIYEEDELLIQSETDPNENKS